ncbi:MAG: aminoacyl-tRNA hydrolase [Sandaracinaceae bacterium]|nr:aminoacyl-tRNA hydrolase [Sandaracinaceae bacterium]
MIELVVGLGNPGPGYAKNRHNVGFRIVAPLASAWAPAFGGRFARAPVGGRDVALLMPETYMNRSGASVVRAMEHLGVALDAVLVVHDELDLPLGALRLKRGGGTGGHNGLGSIVAAAGGPGFDRLRVGIGRPPEGAVVDWVLGDFSESEGARLASVLDDATRALTMAVVDGTVAAMNVVNVRAPGP